MSLRPALPADAPAIAAIWYAGWREAHLGRIPDALLPARSRESFDERALANVPLTTVFEVADEVAGFVMVVDDEVEQVFLDPAHRGAGIADALLSSAEATIASHGFSGAWLAVVAGNDRARAFYARRGWTDEGPFVHQAPGPDGPIPVPCHRYVKARRGNATAPPIR